jgi:hypothetical protein
MLQRKPNQNEKREKRTLANLFCRVAMGDSRYNTGQGVDTSVYKGKFFFGCVAGATSSCPWIFAVWMKFGHLPTNESYLYRKTRNQIKRTASLHAVSAALNTRVLIGTLSAKVVRNVTKKFTRTSLKNGRVSGVFGLKGERVDNSFG